jgi:hypothetical protein
MNRSELGESDWCNLQVFNVDQNMVVLIFLGLIATLKKVKCFGIWAYQRNASRSPSRSHLNTHRCLAPWDYPSERVLKYKAARMFTQNSCTEHLLKDAMTSVTWSSVKSRVNQETQGRFETIHSRPATYKPMSASTRTDFRPSTRLQPHRCSYVPPTANCDNITIRKSRTPRVSNSR